MSDSMTNQQMMAMIAGLQTQMGQMSYMFQQQQRQFGVVPAGQQFAVLQFRHPLVRPVRPVRLLRPTSGWRRCGRKSRTRTRRRISFLRTLGRMSR